MKDIWALRVRLQLEGRVRELALFNLGIDNKLRGCDLVALKVRDVRHGEQMATRAIVMEHKTQRPVQFEITAGTRDALQKTGLTANLLVTPPTGFEVSLTSGSGFASSLSFTPSSGSVPTTTIFVRLTAAASGTPSGNIACTSTGATTQDVAVSGTVYNPTLTVNAQTNVSCFGGTNGAASVNAAAGALAPYSYNWTPGNPAGDGTVSVTGLTAGSWTCTVTDNNGCTSSISFIITDPTVIVANCSGTNVSCNGGNNGFASVSASVVQAL